MIDKLPEFIEQHLDVLQNLEFALVEAYDRNPNLTDTGAIYAIETLIKVYTGELRGREIALPELKPEELDAYTVAKAMCDFRLGRTPVEDESGEKVDASLDLLTLEEVVACLKRVLKSINTWYKRGGRRGYYEYVRQFIR